MLSVYNIDHLFSPDSPEDYVAQSTTLTFAPCQLLRCVDVVLEDDCVLEDTEAFNIRLETIVDQDRRITIDRDTGNETQLWIMMVCGIMCTSTRCGGGMAFDSIATCSSKFYGSSSVILISIHRDASCITSYMYKCYIAGQHGILCTSVVDMSITTFHKSLLHNHKPYTDSWQ